MILNKSIALRGEIQYLLKGILKQFKINSNFSQVLILSSLFPTVDKQFAWQVIILAEIKRKYSLLRIRSGFCF